MNDIKIFNFENQAVRTEVVNNEIFFCAVDVCAILQHTNPSVAIRSLDDDERTKLSLGRQGETWFINESGLYSLTLQSNLPKAKQFKKWVTSEVLPHIRKTGGYMSPNNMPQIDSTFLLQIAQEMKQKEILIANQQHKIESQDNTINETSNTQDSYSLRESKNRLMCDEGKLKEFLKSKKWIQYLSDGSESKKMYSTAYSRDNGFAVDKAVLNKARRSFFHQCRITNKGMDYLIKHRQEILIF